MLSRLDQALVLLMRYSGMRISDAVTLTSEQLDGKERFLELFAQAGVSKGAGNAVSHRFGDTFAAELLFAGVPIERVSILRCHQTVRITEKH